MDKVQYISLLVVFEVLFSVLFASGWASAQETQEKPGISSEQQSRIELMKSKGPEASLMIFPVTYTITGADEKGS